MEPTGLSFNYSGPKMFRSTSQRFTSNGTWTAPAGVTKVIVIPDGGVGTLLTVVPNTTYSITAATSPGSFGSLYNFKTNTSTAALTIVWMDG